jgi:hypothetical protein
VFLALAAGLLLGGCSDNRPSTDEIAQTVKRSMQDYLDRTDNFKQYHAHVTDVTLVKASDNTYNGIAKVSPLRGPDGQVSITVTYDGQNAMWQSPPGAFLFLLQATPSTPTG